MTGTALRAGFLGACPYPVPQGSQVFLRDHARAFAEAGHGACLITYAHGTGEDTSGLIVHRGPRLPFARGTRSGPSLGKPLLDLALVRTVRRVAHAERLQVLVAHNYEALLVALAARACPVVYHAHNIMADELPHYFHGASLARRAGDWFDRVFPRRAQAIAVPHARLQQYLSNACGCDAARIHLISPPIWVNDFPEAHLGDAMPPVVYAGNLDAYQNLPLLLAAMERVRARCPAARLKILTADRLVIPGAEVVPSADFATLTAHLAAGCIFAVPRTAWSGYPVKILNAMAAGVPVVACAGSAHALEHSQTGLAVPDNDAGAFAEALLGLLNDPAACQRLGNAARAHVERHHTPSATAAALAGVCRQAISYSCSPGQKPSSPPSQA